MLFFVLLAALFLVLALSAVVGKLKGFLLALFGVLIPLGLFFLSALLIPDWKGACHCGWVDGFLIGKFALVPIVLFATIALFRCELLLPSIRPERWVQWGLYSGAVTSTVCIIFGFACLKDSHLTVPLILTSYVPVWYIWRAVEMERKFPALAEDYLWSTIGMIPLWAGSWFWSHRVFDQLPNEMPGGCFVVTAAARGHQSLVGPFIEIERGDGRRQANCQLIIFWRVEDVWRRRYPASHRFFRRIYNRVGPRIASRITSPWLADLVFLWLKPAEWLARTLCCTRAFTLSHRR